MVFFDCDLYYFRSKCSNSVERNDHSEYIVYSNIDEMKIILSNTSPDPLIDLYIVGERL